MSIVFATGQHRPGDTSYFVGNATTTLLLGPLTQPMHPLSQSRSVVLDAKQHRTCTVDQHATQIGIAAFTDTEQLLFPPVEYCRGIGHLKNQVSEINQTSRNKMGESLESRLAGVLLRNALE